MAVDGRLEWSQYEGRDGVRRQVHRIVADTIEYLGPSRNGGSPQTEDVAAPQDDIPF